ncbi:MAG: XTP/dITP diphosphatase [Candidatus Eisenbacteria bacterium]
MLLVVATRNPDKLVELRHALTGLDLEIRSAADFPSIPEVEETGATLEENARLKAHAIHRAAGALALADDTGLEVDALDGAPGIHSARFAGPGRDYDDNVEKLLTLMRDVPDGRRGARFRTVIVLVLPRGEERTIEGRCEGHILRERRGGGGFGYDPVFLVSEAGRTFAEMTLAEKDGLSHRGRAMREARRLLEDFLHGAGPQPAP